MDKVKIKRLLRKKKTSTTNEKVMAAFGLGASLLGTAMSGGAQAQNPKPIVSSIGNQQGNKLLAEFGGLFQRYLGIPQAKADDPFYMGGSSTAGMSQAEYMCGMASMYNSGNCSSSGSAQGASLMSVPISADGSQTDGSQSILGASTGFDANGNPIALGNANAGNPNIAPVSGGSSSPQIQPSSPTDPNQGAGQSGAQLDNFLNTNVGNLDGSNLTPGISGDPNAGYNGNPGTVTAPSTPVATATPIAPAATSAPAVPSSGSPTYSSDDSGSFVTPQDYIDQNVADNIAAQVVADTAPADPIINNSISTGSAQPTMPTPVVSAAPEPNIPVVDTQSFPSGQPAAQVTFPTPPTPAPAPTPQPVIPTEAPPVIDNSTAAVNLNAGINNIPAPATNASTDPNSPPSAFLPNGNSYAQSQPGIYIDSENPNQQYTVVNGQWVSIPNFAGSATTNDQANSIATTPTPIQTTTNNSGSDMTPPTPAVSSSPTQPAFTVPSNWTPFQGTLGSDGANLYVAPNGQIVSEEGYIYSEVTNGVYTPTNATYTATPPGPFTIPQGSITLSTGGNDGATLYTAPGSNTAFSENGQIYVSNGTGGYTNTGNTYNPNIVYSDPNSPDLNQNLQTAPGSPTADTSETPLPILSTSEPKLNPDVPAAPSSGIINRTTSALNQLAADAKKVLPGSNSTGPSGYFDDTYKGNLSDQTDKNNPDAVGAVLNDGTKLSNYGSGDKTDGSDYKTVSGVFYNSDTDKVYVQDPQSGKGGSSDFTYIGIDYRQLLSLNSTPETPQQPIDFSQAPSSDSQLKNMTAADVANALQQQGIAFINSSDSSGIYVYVNPDEPYFIPNSDLKSQNQTPSQIKIPDTLYGSNGQNDLLVQVGQGTYMDASPQHNLYALDGSTGMPYKTGLSVLVGADGQPLVDSDGYLKVQNNSQVLAAQNVISQAMDTNMQALTGGKVGLSVSYGSDGLVYITSNYASGDNSSFTETMSQKALATNVVSMDTSGLGIKKLLETGGSIGAAVATGGTSAFMQGGLGVLQNNGVAFDPTQPVILYNKNNGDTVVLDPTNFKDPTVAFVDSNGNTQYEFSQSDMSKLLNGQAATNLVNGNSVNTSDIKQWVNIPTSLIGKIVNTAKNAGAVIAPAVLSNNPAQGVLTVWSAQTGTTNQPPAKSSGGRLGGIFGKH